MAEVDSERIAKSVDKKILKGLNITLRNYGPASAKLHEWQRPHDYGSLAW